MGVNNIPKIVISKTSSTDSSTNEHSPEWPKPTYTKHRRRLLNRRSQSICEFPDDAYSPAEIRRIRDRLLRSNVTPRTSTIRLLNRNQKMTLVCLALVDFMSFCSMSIMAPFFPKEAALKGMNGLTSGFVFSFYALVMFISSPIFGKILPTVGVKFLFLSGIFVAGACNLLFGLLEYIEDYERFTVFCFLVRGMEALGASAYSTASYIFVVTSFPNSIGSVLGILETFVGLGMSVGPAIGGLLYSVGGFGMPFYVLGILMTLIVPINMCWMPKVDECSVQTKGGSLLKLLKIPSVLVMGIVVVVVSNTWGFLDPTLEPHLRQFDLSPEQIGLIFLLFSALYGISSPLWGMVADKYNNHWSMTVWGLLFCTVGLVLLGPSPYLPIKGALWLDIVALSILGVSVALTLLPTFQSILTSAIEGGCEDSLPTCSIVAGLWSCMYALGEVIGPALGGVLLQHVGFPNAATVMAAITLSLAVLTFFYYVIKENCCVEDEYSSDSGISSSFRSYRTDYDVTNEKVPLLGVSTRNNNHRMYTMEKVMYYEERRRSDYEVGEIDRHQVTDVRGTVFVTSHGSCEV